MKAFTYSRPQSLTAAVSEHSRTDHDDGVRFFAGGTDLLTLMKQEIVSPRHLVDLKRLPDLSDAIEIADDRIELGCLTTLAAIESHPVLRTECTALTDAAAIAATPQLRNMATIAGNLLQRPRCWYFRHPDINCWLKGGDDCPARDGENSHHAIFATDESPCVAVHPSDPAAALMALDATARVQGANGERSVALQDLFALPEDVRRRETTLETNEVIVSLSIPRPRNCTRTTYLKAMDRKVWAFALVGVAVSLRLDGQRIVEATIVLSGVAPRPWQISDAAECLVGQSPSQKLFADFAEHAVASAAPLGKNGYKVHIARSLIQRALTTVAHVVDE